MIEQLDCYCNPKDQSIIQQELQGLGSLAHAFGVDNPLDRESAVLMTLTFSKDSQVEQAVSRELGSIGYSDDQVNSV
jgi:hypothetical protein